MSTAQEGLAARLAALERRAPLVRRGTVTAVAPLAVAVGAADGSYTDLASIAPVALAVGDEVLALQWGRSLLIMGLFGGLDPLSIWRVLLNESAIIPGGTAAATGAPADGNFLGVGGTTGVAPMPLLQAADYAVPGRTTTIRIDLTLAVNATAPAANFTAALAPVTAVAGGAGVLAYTLGSPVTTATVNTPGASSRSHQESAVVALPSDGYYILTLTTSATTAANSRVGATVRLLMRHA